MLTHLDQNNQPNMVDISHKENTYRQASARGEVQLPLEMKPYLQGEDLILNKGPVIQTAIIAGTMAVKKTADLIPFCHSLPLQSCKFTINIDEKLCVTIECEVKTTYKTGVEMEALCGVSVAALTIYDMCKSVSSNIVIKNTQLLSKMGGKSALPLHGLVLTGGKSQRMQRDKALIDYHNQPHGEFLYHLLGNFCEKVFISARQQQWQDNNLASLPTLVDEGESHGPFSGIITALRSNPHVNWLIIACDLAYLQPDIIANLVNHHHQDVVATCYQNTEKGFPEALCGIYTPRALDLFTKAEKAQIYCPVKVLQMGDCQLISPQRPSDIANINTPEEYQQVINELIIDNG